jgi:cytochrome P450 family 6
MIYFILFGLSAIYLVLKYVYSHWQRSGFPYKDPNIPFGNLVSVIQKKRSFGTAIFDLYNKSHEPFIGIYLFFRPALLVRDADLVRNVLIKDFDSFHDRGVHCDEVNDPTSANLFALPGVKWRNMRAKLTPTFTSGKLKSMMPTLLDVADVLNAHLTPKANDNQIVEMKETMTCYVLNIIGSVFFGFNVDTFADPNTEFRQIAKDMIPDGFFEGLRATASFLCPK